MGGFDALVVNAGSRSLVAISESWLDKTEGYVIVKKKELLYLSETDFITQ